MAAPTDVLRRPPGPRAPRRPPAGPGRSAARPLTALGMTAALQSAGLGVLAVMVTVLVGWATAADSDASATAAVTGALQAWLVGHHAEVTVPGGSFGLAPLGMTLLPLLLLHTSTLRAGRAAGVRSRRAVLALTASVTATYAVLVTVVALLARTDTGRPAAPRCCGTGCPSRPGGPCSRRRPRRWCSSQAAPCSPAAASPSTTSRPGP